MVRPNDEFWNYVEKVGGLCKCKFCGFVFSGKTSIWRFKCHLSGVEGQGVNVCGQVPADVKEKAYDATQNSNNKRHKTVPSSSNNEARNTLPTSSQVQTAEQETGAARSPFDAEFINAFQSLCGEGLDVIHNTLDAPNIQDENEVRDARNTLPTSSRQQTNEVENRARGGEFVQEDFSIMEQDMGAGRRLQDWAVATSSREKAEAGSTEQEMGGGGEQENWNRSMIEDMTQPTERGSSPKGPVVDAQENIIANAQQITDGDLVGEAVSKPWDEIISSLMEDQTLCNDGDNLGVSLPTRELVGHAFEENKKEIWSRLMEDDVLSIGVWGMGEVGKTTLMTHVHNQLLERRPNTFAHVHWVTVSQDFSIYKLQNLIAKAINFVLSKDDDERIRATKLCDELIKKQKFVLILDDLWNQFDVEEVGIPVRVNGCKLILTTRSRKICRQMHVNEENVIKVEPLSQREAWSLFQKELGNYNTKLEPLAKAVASECAGLPLGLRTMARSMRGVGDVSEWRNALEELKEAEKREDDMEPEVFRILRYSYNRLTDSMLQECFLYCALFPEDFKIKRDDLIEYWIVEGIIMGKKSRQAEHDKGHDILNKLENVCLLEGWKDRKNGRVVKMHDLIRDMAIQKLREKSVTVEAGRQLTELPEVEKWTEDLVRVSLMKNDILGIPSSHSPRCPKLSTILLRSNEKLSFIADSFFLQLHGLTVLDVSHTKINKLPKSISELVGLIALLLRGCNRIKHIPSLAKLKALKKLDLSFTGVKEIPKGMELLSNLRYLNLGRSRVKELASGILPNFSHLQVLILIQFCDLYQIKTVSVNEKEVACLRKLETVECYFEHLFDFNEYMESRKEILSLCTYFFLIGEFYHGFLSHMYYKTKSSELSKIVWLSGCSRQEDFVAFPEDIEELVIMGCNIPRTLFVAFSLGCSTKLKVIHLSHCHGIKSLLSMSSSSSADILKSLESLILTFLDDFRDIISKEEVALRPLSSNATFSCLKYFEIWGCIRVKRLFPFGLLSNLQNLEIIEVGGCPKMEEILVVEEEVDDGNNDDENEEEEEGSMGEKNNSSSNNLPVQFWDEEEEGNMGEKNNSNSDNLPVQFSFPKLKRLMLRDLPKLKSICRGVMICDSLQQIVLVDCPKLKRIPLSFPLPSLQKIQAYPAEWWKSVEWGHISEKNLLQPKVFFFRSAGPA